MIILWISVHHHHHLLLLYNMCKARPENLQHGDRHQRNIRAKLENKLRKICYWSLMLLLLPLKLLQLLLPLFPSFSDFMKIYQLNTIGHTETFNCGSDITYFRSWSGRGTWLIWGIRIVYFPWRGFDTGNNNKERSINVFARLRFFYIFIIIFSFNKMRMRWYNDEDA